MLRCTPYLLVFVFVTMLCAGCAGKSKAPQPAVTPVEILGSEVPYFKPYITGGWGDTAETAVVFKKAPEFYDFIRIEYAMLPVRNTLQFTKKPYGKRTIVAHATELEQSLLDLNGKKYDRLQYVVLTASEDDAEKVASIVRANPSEQEALRLLKPLITAHPMEYWFDITEVFGGHAVLMLEKMKEQENTAKSSKKN